MDRKEKALLIAIGANLFLIVLRFILAAVSGSIALKANAWHSFADIFVSSIVLTGLFISRKGKTATGKGVSKIENIVAIFVSLFIFYMAYEIFTEAIGAAERELLYVIPVIIGALAGVAVNYFMARLKMYVGRETNSPSLIADGYHSKMDMYASIAVIIGLVGYLLGLGNLDKVAAIIVVLFIVVAGFEILTGAVNVLSSKAVEFPLMDGAKKHIRRVTGILIPFVLIAYFLSGFYYVKWNELGVVRRFGKIIKKDIDPGLHYTLPSPIDIVDKVDVTQIRKIKTDLQLLLTGDENLINMSAVVHYKIRSVVDYLFKITEPEQLVTFAAQSALRQTTGERDVDGILTFKKLEIQNHLKDLVQKTLDISRSGIEVVDVYLEKTEPPRDVADAFRDVASAREDKVTYINEAYAYANSLIPEARGEASKMLLEAEGHKIDRVNRATGEANRFVDKSREYGKAKVVTETRMHLEIVEKVLPRVKQKYILGKGIKTDNTDLWFIGKDIKGIIPGK